MPEGMVGGSIYISNVSVIGGGGMDGVVRWSALASGGVSFKTVQPHNVSSLWITPLSSSSRGRGGGVTKCVVCTYNTLKQTLRYVTIGVIHLF